MKRQAVSSVNVLECELHPKFFGCVIPMLLLSHTFTSEASVVCNADASSDDPCRSKTRTAYILNMATVNGNAVCLEPCFLSG